VKTHVMKRTDREKKAAEEDYVVPWNPGAADYPRGLCITLDDSSLKKLGIDQMPKPGDKFKIEGEAHVLESAQRDTDQNSDRRVELVLHELGAEAKPGNSADKPEKSIREDIEDARHQARGTNAAGGGRIGARFVTANGG
jgi:hypothetical protein